MKKTTSLSLRISSLPLKIDESRLVQHIRSHTAAEKVSGFSAVVRNHETEVTCQVSTPWPEERAWKRLQQAKYKGSKITVFSKSSISSIESKTVSIQLLLTNFPEVCLSSPEKLRQHIQCHVGKVTTLEFGKSKRGNFSAVCVAELKPKKEKSKKKIADRLRKSSFQGTSLEVELLNEKNEPRYWKKLCEQRRTASKEYRLVQDQDNKPKMTAPAQSGLKPHQSNTMNCSQPMHNSSSTCDNGLDVSFSRDAPIISTGKSPLAGISLDGVKQVSVAFAHYVQEEQELPHGTEDIGYLPRLFDKFAIERLLKIPTQTTTSVETHTEADTSSAPAPGANPVSLEHGSSNNVNHDEHNQKDDNQDEAGYSKDDNNHTENSHDGNDDCKPEGETGCAATARVDGDDAEGTACSAAAAAAEGDDGSLQSTDASNPGCTLSDTPTVQAILTLERELGIPNPNESSVFETLGSAIMSMTVSDEWDLVDDSDDK